VYYRDSREGLTAVSVRYFYKGFCRIFGEVLLYQGGNVYKSYSLILS